MSCDHVLLLLRHAQAEDFAPGLNDEDRRLTEHGTEQARAVGDFLRAGAIDVDLVLCSSAVRTLQTADQLGVTCDVQVTAKLYNAGSDAIRQLVSELPETAHTVLIVGHAPGIPALAHDLAGPDSCPDALSRISSGYPPASLVSIAFAGPWAELESGRLVVARTDG